MVRYGKTHPYDNQDDDPQQMKVYRADRKYRGHKLAVGIGHNQAVRAENNNAHKTDYAGDFLKQTQHRIRSL